MARKRRPIRITAETYLFTKGPMRGPMFQQRLAMALTGLRSPDPCDACGKVGWPGWMVHNHVWAVVAKPHGLLCLDCFEAILDRTVNADDLPDVPLNDWILLRFANGLTRHDAL